LPAASASRPPVSNSDVAGQITSKMTNASDPNHYSVTCSYDLERQ
jgi:hypothetical protein